MTPSHLLCSGQSYGPDTEVGSMNTTYHKSQPKETQFYTNIPININIHGKVSLNFSLFTIYGVEKIHGTYYVTTIFYCYKIGRPLSTNCVYSTGYQILSGVSVTTVTYNICSLTYLM